MNNTNPTKTRKKATDELKCSGKTNRKYVWSFVKQTTVAVNKNVLAIVQLSKS
jgi:hypothetical protein